MNAYFKLWIKRVIWTVAVLAILWLMGAVVFYWEFVRPLLKHQRLVDADAAGQQVDAKELRDAAHVCMRRFMYHDAAITLERYGDTSSVPLLINALRRVPKSDSEEGAVVCTFAHCSEALEKITGQHFGFDADAWEKWWKSQH